MKPEKIKEFLDRIEKIKSIMIDIATNQSNVWDEEEYYQEIYQEIDITIDFLNEDNLNVRNINTFETLGEWYDFYDDKSLNTQARKKYVYELYSDIIYKAENYLYDLNLKSNNNSFNFDISQVDKLLKNLEAIKSIMIDVATKKSKVEDDNEIYIKIWQEIALQIRQLQIINIPIANPSSFRELSHWQAHYSCELENYKYRREYVNNLYSSIINPIRKAIKRYNSTDASVEDFLEYLKRYLAQANSNQSSAPIYDVKQERPQPLDIKNIKASSHQDAIKELAPIDNNHSLESNVIYSAMATVNDSQNKLLENKTDVVIITALSKEQNAILKYLESPKIIKSSGRTFHKASIRTSKSEITYQVIILCLHGMGSDKAGNATQRAITEFNPSQIILAGIAGGVPKENSRYLGDIIVGEQIINYGLNKQVRIEQDNPQTQRRYEVYRPARVMLEAAKNLPLQNWVFCIKAQRPDGTTGRINPDVHFGAIASGNTVIADQHLRDELKSDWSQLVGIEMEGAGAALAAYESDFMPGILLVKGMCDWADGSKNDDWQEYAAETAASFVIGLLKTAPFESKLKLDLHSNYVSSEETLSESNSKSENSIHENRITTISTVHYSGKVKITICNRLVRDWEDLADYFDIKLHERETFEKGKEARRVWEWLELRNKLNDLEDALIEIGREDLVEILNKEIQ